MRRALALAALLPAAGPARAEDGSARIVAAAWRDQPRRRPSDATGPAPARSRANMAHRWRGSRYGPAIFGRTLPVDPR